jgi:hypothetical protein
VQQDTLSAVIKPSSFVGGAWSPNLRPLLVALGPPFWFFVRTSCADHIAGLRSNAMSFKHLRGVENSTLRRRIVRAEQDLPKMLRGDRRRRGHTMHAIHGPDPAPQPPIYGARPASEAQTPIGAQLSLPPNHAAASWLSTSWTVPGLADPLPDVLGPLVMPPTLPSPDAARWRGHGIHGATPAPQPPPLHAEATAAATPRAGSKRSFMDARQPDGEDPAVCAKRGCPDLPATVHLQAAQLHSVYRTTLQTQARTTLDSATLGPKNKFHQTDDDPDTVHTSITRAESPSTDFACFASAPSGNSFARAASISTDFSRVTSAENRAFARLLSSSAHGTLPGFLVGGAGARDSHACEFPMASQAGGGIEERTEADGRWEMGDGRWEMGDGRWEMGDGR